MKMRHFGRQVSRRQISPSLGVFGRSGFTLAEALVSVTILLIVMTAVGRLFSIAGDAMMKSSAHNDAMSTLRILGQQLEEDLSAMPSDSFVGILFQYDGPGVTMPDQAPTAGVFARSDRIVFYTSRDVASLNRDLFVRDIKQMGLSEKYSFPGPVRAGMARVYYGHSDDLFAGWAEDGVMRLYERKLARRITVLAPNLGRVYDQDLFDSLWNPLDVDVALAEQNKAFDSFDYCFQSAEEFESAPRPDNGKAKYDDYHDLDEWEDLKDKVTYRDDFLSEDPRAVLSWVRRPTIAPKETVTLEGHWGSDKKDVPVGVHMLMATGVAEFKVQVWMEDDDPEYLSRADWTEGSITNPPVNSANIPAEKNEVEHQRTVPGSSLFPRWWPEEDFEEDDVVTSIDPVRIDERKEKGESYDGNFVKDSDFGNLLVVVDNLNDDKDERLHGQFGIYFGGPVDASAGPQNGPKNVIHFVDPVTGVCTTSKQTYRGSRKRPRAIRITIRLLDPNGRFTSGQSHSIVIPMRKQ